MNQECHKGFALITVLMLMGLLLGLLGIYYVTTSSEIASVRSTRSAASGFYAAEAGLNIRAETIRQIFVGYNRPSGTSPLTASPCQGANTGSGDFACISSIFNTRNVKTWIEEDPGNPITLTIPPGERYQNLTAQEYLYTAKSKAYSRAGLLESNLELKFKSRLVPLFQFAAFYNKDLEILPGPTMTLTGPVHANGNIYLYSNSATLTINGQVSSSGDLYKGRKDGSVTPSCNNNAVYIYDPLNPRSLIPNCPARTRATLAVIAPFNNMIQIRVPAVTVPAPEVFDPTPGKVYWDRADLRVVLALAAGEVVVGVQVRKADDSVDAAASATLNACAGVVSGRAVGTTQIWNYRENKNIRILDVDVIGVLNCLKNSNWFGSGKRLDDTTDGGLVFHLTVKGPSSALLPNPYGVRLRNAAQIRSTVNSAPIPKGITVISDQAAYIWGNYNSLNKLPAAVMADVINVLSTNWNDANSHSGIGSRIAANTTINSAFLAGTDTTGGIEGTGGQGGAYNGGLENYPRFHEDWSGGKILTYRGSFVSLGRPRHVNGSWGSQSYSPPNRDWNYDTSFNNAANLPPITPRFVYLRQELFVRDFVQ